MPENIQLSSAVSAGPVIATDAQGTTHYPVTKLVYGSTGTYVWVSSVNPLPVVSTTPETIVPLTTASVIQTEPKAGAVFPISGNTSASVSTGGAFAAPFAEADFDSSAVSTQNRIMVGIAVPSLAGATLIGTTSGLPVTQTTASQVQVEPIVGATFAISGNSTATINNSTAAPVPIKIENALGSTLAVPISGNCSASISGNTTATINNTTVNPVPISVVVGFGSTVAMPISGNCSATISGNSTVTVNNSTAAPVPITIVNGLGSTVAMPVRPHAALADSTWASTSLTSTVAAGLLSSGASTRFGIVDVLAINSGANEVILTLFDGTTAGAKLLMAPLSTADGGFAHTFGVPRLGTAGNTITAQISAASTVYINVGAFRFT